MSVAEDLKTKNPEEVQKSILKTKERLRREVQRELDAEERPPHPPLRALSVEELFARPNADYLVDQLLPIGALAELVGDSESLKSFFAIHLGMAVAAHQHDFFGQKVVRHGPVLYIAAEGQGAFQYRLRAWGQAHDVDLAVVPFRTIAAPVDLRDPIFQHELETIIAAVCPLLVVVDTLHRCMPGAEENSSRDLGEVVAFATRLNTTYQITVLFLHHPPKNAVNGRGRGSSALYYAADTELSAQLLGKPQPNGVKLVEFKVVKQKDDAKVEFTLVNRIVPVLDDAGRAMAYHSGRGITSCVLKKAEDIDVQRATGSEELNVRITTFVAAHPHCSKSAIHDSVGGNRSKVFGRIQELIDDGQLLMSHGKLCVGNLTAGME